MSTNHHPHHGRKAQPQHRDHPEPVLRPPADEKPKSNADAAVELIRQKVAALYGEEPNAKQEMAEAVQTGARHSKHQQFMLRLHDSGKSMSQIQTEWHQYYLGLSDEEKREVWQEFYSQSAQVRQEPSRLEPRYHYTPEPNPEPKPEPLAPAAEPHPARPGHQPDTSAIYPIPATEPAEPAANPLYAGGSAAAPEPATEPQAATATDPRPPGTIRQQLRDRVASRGKLQAKHHIQSLLFGLGFGALTLLIVLFGFFNEVVIAPFIQPSRTVNATPIIMSPDGVAPSGKNEVIIPKINVQIPLDFSAKTIDEQEFEAALDRGVAHYPTTALPGQQGNASFFGHSSNNIFNPGKYKFAFVMLNELVEGDTFYITYNGKVYSYQVYEKKVVAADAVEILNPVAGKPATAMLVTCDPPGTSLRRLAVWGVQTSPSPSSNTAAAKQPTGQAKASSEALPGNGPTLWGRFWNWVSGD